MAINIKPIRAEIDQPSVGNRGTTLLDTVRQNRISYESLTADISNTASKINAHNQAIEKERIRNKATKENSLMNLDIEKYIQEIELGDKDGNPYNKIQIDALVKKFETDLTSKYLNGKYSKDTDRSKAYFESYFWNNMTTLSNKSHQVVKKRILADSKITFTTIKQNHENQKIIGGDGMWAAYELQKKEITDAYNNLLALDGGAGISLDNELATIELRFFKKAVSSATPNNLRTDAMNNQVTDNMAVVEFLKQKDDKGNYVNKEFFAEGGNGKLTDEMRETLITHFQNEASNQAIIEGKYIKRTNDDILSKNMPSVIDGSLDINQINDLTLVGPDAESIKADLKELRKRVILNQIPKEADIKTYKHINEGLIDGSITSLHQKFLVEGEVATTKNPDGWSIIDRMKLDQKSKHGAVSDTDGQKWKNFLDQKYSNPEYLKNIRDFEAWWKKYEKAIIGKHQSDMDNITPSGLKRMEAVKAEALRIYLDGINKGISAENLRNPDTKDYLWTQMGGVKKFIPTYAMETNEIKEFFSTKMGTNEADAPYLEGGEFAPPRKKVTQSYNDWINSKEYLEWKNSDKYQKWIIWFNEKNNASK